MAFSCKPVRTAIEKRTAVKLTLGILELIIIHSDHVQPSVPASCGTACPRSVEMTNGPLIVLLGRNVSVEIKSTKKFAFPKADLFLKGTLGKTAKWRRILREERIGEKMLFCF